MCPKQIIRCDVFQGTRTMSGHCDIHGDFTGIGLKVGDDVHPPGCPDCVEAKRAAIANAEIAKVEEVNRRRRRVSLREAIGHAGIPPRHTGKGFKNFIADGEKKRMALDVAVKYAQDFPEMLEQGRGLVFIGGTGTGKTHLATAIGTEVVRLGYSVLFLTTLKAVQLVKDTYHRSAEITERQAIAELVKYDLLILDEVGVQHGSSTETVILTELLNQRYELMKPVIMLSNYPFKRADNDSRPSLTSVLGDRVMSRLHECATRVVCDWEDYRASA